MSEPLVVYQTKRPRYLVQSKYINDRIDDDRWDPVHACNDPDEAMHEADRLQAELPLHIYRVIDTHYQVKITRSADVDPTPEEAFREGIGR